MSNEITPFEAIRRTNPAGNEFWSSRDFAKVLGRWGNGDVEVELEKREDLPYIIGLIRQSLEKQLGEDE